MAQARRERDEADELLEQAHAEAEQRKERGEKLTKKLPTFALFAAIGLTASGEWSLAVLVGFPLLVAPLLPIAIDVYVIAAFRRHRDTFTAISLMVIANVLVHLAEAGLFGVTGTGDNVRPTWWLVALVVSIGPFVLWRVHALRDHPATAAAPATPPAPEEQAAPVAPTAAPPALPPGTGTGEVPPTGSGNSAPATGIASGNGSGNTAGSATGNTASATGGAPSGKPGTAAGNRQRRTERRASRNAGGRAPRGTGREELRDAVRERITALLADGQTPSPTELGREFNADAEWVRNQIRAVKKHLPDQPATVPARPATEEEA